MKDESGHGAGKGAWDLSRNVFLIQAKSRIVATRRWSSYKDGHATLLRQILSLWTSGAIWNSGAQGGSPKNSFLTLSAGCSKPHASQRKNKTSRAELDFFE
jgi:hypothetical protein